MALNWKQAELEELSEAQYEVAQAEAQLNAAFYERRSVLRSMVIAAIIKENGLLLGPPGTGKSLMTRTFAEAFAGGSYFEILMTKYTVPEEIFGPVAFSKMKQDKYERAMSGYAPDMRIWFLDEIWKASSAILNALLKATNEHRIRNGANEIDLVLESVFGCSNEYPQDDSLAPMFDRFPFKHWVEDINRGNLRKLWENGGVPKPVTARVDPAHMEIIRRAVCEMTLSPGQLDTLEAIHEAVSQEGFHPSTRTWSKSLKIIKGAAIAAGRTEVQGPDFTVLADVLWKEHKDRPKLQAAVGNAADPYGSRAEAIVDGVRAAMQALPTMDALKGKQKTKAEMIKIIASVSGQVSAERDKIEEVLAEAGSGNPAIDEAKDTVEAAQRQVDGLMQEVTWYRESK